MDPFILKKKEARVLAIWETLCQHPDACILLYNLLNQCNIKLCWVDGRVKAWEEGNRAVLVGESHLSCALTREKSCHCPMPAVY